MKKTSLNAAMIGSQSHTPIIKMRLSEGVGSVKTFFSLHYTSNLRRAQ